MDLPERRKTGTHGFAERGRHSAPAPVVHLGPHRNHGAGLRAAATPGSERYPSYCPRTTIRTSSGFTVWKTLSFSSRSGPALSDTGGSMATNAITWNRWVTIMSR